MTAPPKRPEDRIPIQALRAFDTIFARVYHNLRIAAPAHLPRRGAAIVVCNHISSVDPLLLQSASPQRLVVWMMAKEYMDLPALGPIFRTLGVIPVDRGGRDTSSLRAALRGLNEGRILGIFPEGKISTTDDLLPFHTGAALMAIKANVPVYPAYQDGTQRGQDMWAACLRRQRAAVAFGPPVQFDRSDTKRETLEAATAAITAAIAALRPAVRDTLGRHVGKAARRPGRSVAEDERDPEPFSDGPEGRVSSAGRRPKPGPPGRR